MSKTLDTRACYQLMIREQHIISGHSVESVPMHPSPPLCRVFTQVVGHHDLHCSVKVHTSPFKTRMLNNSNGIITTA